VSGTDTVLPGDVAAGQSGSAVVGGTENLAAVATAGTGAVASFATPGNSAAAGAVGTVSAAAFAAPGNSAAVAATGASDSVGATTLYHAPADRKPYSADEIKNFCADPNITELFFIIETYLKHPLASTDTNIVLYWYDQLDFSAELIIYLVEYCISKGHSSMRYMDKVALGWHESGIRTVEQAKENAAIHSQAYYGVMKALGITGRNLVDSEVAFVNKWSKEYAFDLPLIREACSRTISAIHQPSFEYTDSILTNWYKNQVHTPEDIKALDDSYSKNKKSAPAANISSTGTAKRNRFNNFDQREYDFNQLEKMLLTTSVQ
jgi:DnaD/phage-associated family protein